MAIEPPRSAKPEELPSIECLADTVFMGGVSGAMKDMFPQLFNSANLENLFVVVDKGRVVSLVGLLKRMAVISGCNIPVAMMGAVCTHDEYRNGGLASQLVQMAFEKANNDGADLMLISGNRSLYHRIGACPVGCNAQAMLDTAVLETLQTADLSVSPAVAGDLRQCAEIYDQKPSRFVRPPKDWSCFLAARATLEQHRYMLAIRSSRLIVGYLVLTKPQAGLADVIEFGGEPDIVASALNKAAKSAGATVLKITLHPDDLVLKGCLLLAGVVFSNVPVDGAWTILNLERLMVRLRSVVEKRTRLDCTFQEHDDIFTVTINGEILSLSRIEAVRLLFGSLDPISYPEPFQHVFPLPTWPYGINYV